MQPKTIFPQSDVLEYAMAEASVYGSSTYELSKEFLQMKPPFISNCTMVVANPKALLLCPNTLFQCNIYCNMYTSSDFAPFLVSILILFMYFVLNNCE